MREGQNRHFRDHFLIGLRPRRPTFWNARYSLKRLRYSATFVTFIALTREPNNQDSTFPH